MTVILRYQASARINLRLRLVQGPVQGPVMDNTALTSNPAEFILTAVITLCFKQIMYSQLYSIQGSYKCRGGGDATIVLSSSCGSRCHCWNSRVILAWLSLCSSPPWGCPRHATVCLQLAVAVVISPLLWGTGELQGELMGSYPSAWARGHGGRGKKRHTRTFWGRES